MLKVKRIFLLRSPMKISVKFWMKDCIVTYSCFFFSDMLSRDMPLESEETACVGLQPFLL